MHYTMTKPCGDCPFRRVGGIKLRPARIREISGYMLGSQGAPFSCHKSVDYSDDISDHRPTDDEIHCAGGLLYAEKQNRAHQMMRIMERLGMYDATKLDRSDFGLVWDNLQQWLSGGSAKAKARGEVAP